MKNINIEGTLVGKNCPTYFIADIAANHDGNLERAKLLCSLAKDSGADAVKFQHHNCKKYVSDYGFKNLGSKQSHQTSWNKSIYEVYKDAEVPIEWTEGLKQHCADIGITMFSTPYDLEMVDFLDDFVSCYKIGSGDLAFEPMLHKVAKKKKPVMIATGASTLEEVIRAVNILAYHKVDTVLMQCNTNYTGLEENFDYINLNVLKTYEKLFPQTVLGLSDHTAGHLTVLGSVAIGGRVIEKHFTDDTSRVGPDHSFSMNPETWALMVEQTRILERALGNGIKTVEDNERETVVLQRRAIRFTKQMPKGSTIGEADFEFQRPCPQDHYPINDFAEIIGKKVKREIPCGDYLKSGDVE